MQLLTLIGAIVLAAIIYCGVMALYKSFTTPPKPEDKDNANPS